MITLEIRLFNKMRKYAADSRSRFQLIVPENVTYPALLKIPSKDVFVAFRNGRNVTLFPEHDTLADGDTIALSGPVPFSRGYGAPVV
jgi:hypothetical protein